MLAADPEPHRRPLRPILVADTFTTFKKCLLFVPKQKTMNSMSRISE